MDQPRFSSLLFFIFFTLLTSPLSLQQQHPKLSNADLNALKTIKASLTGIPGSTFFSTWDFTAPNPCSSFSGLTCSIISSSLRVTALSLGTGLSDSPGLAGTLSPSLSQLTELTQLLLFPGLVTGLIPTQLAKLTNLRVISLTNNRLNGPIPTSLSTLTNLHTLDLSYNQLSGSIPPRLTELPRLKVLILASNSLTGELPSVSTQLLHLDLKRNRFNGKLPPSMPLSLRYLSVSENNLWGPLNNGLESLSELVYLDLSMNQFSGPIPASLFNPTLSSLLLQRNNLSGGVPHYDPTKSTSSYGESSIVDLSHNMLTGEISRVLVGVESLFLNNNRLIGIVPEEYTKSLYLGNTKTLYLQHNYLTGIRLETRVRLPDTTSLCLSYNCMVPPEVGLTACPSSAGSQILRPAWQCSVFNHGSSRG
ncbi:probably inactive leucine-rich repeat receptor-like protein kinase IMK2 [Fagus crenata]